ncbi:MAG TPA: diguanylate cyclase [Candidatus Elarobacter sp.]|jgi:diguanylate cyclase (GGDEF)-like protein
MKVLLVDDSKVARELTAWYLTEMGHPVVQAPDGKTALALYRSENPDIVLLDVEMPEMNGYAVAREMRKNAEERWVPIIFLSGRVGDDDVALGIEAGGDDYIAKPVGPVVLKAKLNAMRRITEMQSRLLEMSRQLQQVNRELVTLSSSDGLTGIANRRTFDRSLELEWQRGLRSAKPLALVISDVDFFKRYNDTYGHHEGDACLRAVAGALAGAVSRPADVVARFGGEEFVVLLPETDIDGAVVVAEQLAEAVRALRLRHEKSDAAPHVTMSFGVASCVPAHALTSDRLVETADQALYEAKSAGRDRVRARPLAVETSA